MLRSYEEVVFPAPRQRLQPETGLPEKFSKTEGVKWAVTLPGPSAATPVIWADRVFLPTADTASGKQAALCLDRRTGRQLWRTDVSEFTTDGQYSNSCSPSPVTDGKIVVFFYGTGDLVAFDVAGKKLWERTIGPFAFQWTFSSTPLLHDGRLIMQVLQRDVAVRGRGKPTGNESFLLAIDPATGKDLWRSLRPSEAVAESREAFSTPLPFTHAGRKELVVIGGDRISGHDPANGRELWTWGTWNPTRIGHWRLVPSPTVGASVILVRSPFPAPRPAQTARCRRDGGLCGVGRGAVRGADPCGGPDARRRAIQPDGRRADPQLVLYAGTTQAGENNDWTGTTAFTTAFAHVGAFALPTGSKDAALLATLMPGTIPCKYRGWAAPRESPWWKCMKCADTVAFS